ncbi:MAG TPA: acyl-CoA dehydrogenase family protein [Chloroflexota bacterium]
MLAHVQAIERAERLSEGFRGRVPTADALRRLPDETIADLFAADLFGLATPRRYGGSELGPETWIEVTSRLAAACGSTGWVYGVLLGHMWLVSQFPVEAQTEVFCQSQALVASLVRLKGAAPRRVPGGFRLRGARGRFCSGIDHARWVVVGGSDLEDGDTPVPYWFLLPKADVTVVDDWFSVGLQGSGSKSIEVADAFIPEHRAIRQADLKTGLAPGRSVNTGALYRLPGFTWAFPLPATCLGIAREALRACRKLLRAKYATDLDAHSSTLATLGEAASDIEMAYQLLLNRARRLTESAERPYSPLEVVAHQRDIAFAVQRARRAVNQLMELSGGSGVYAAAAIERLWRDCNTSAAHGSFGWDTTMAAYGRALLEC